MLGLIGLIPTILTFATGLGTTVSSISRDLRDKELARTKAQSDKEVKQIDADIQALHDRKDVLVAEAGSRINAFVRAAIAIGPAMYVLKYYAWDKVLGSLFLCTGDAARNIPFCSPFRTDGLNTEMAVVLTAVLGFYFLTSWKK
jgi:hypothetical protein